ncbi:hypothetical protein [Nocardia carnea]|uniref:hypothetical protein n=1 Tax=Nocardia carnea TaxID=37328 RepID=UPI00245898FD|nr:hypothetical protein [Nocardia carnea]
MAGARDRQRAIEQAVVATRDLIEAMRAELERRRDAGEPTAALDRDLVELEQSAAELRDAQSAAAIRAVVERHGVGPYPDEDLAVLAGLSVTDARRALQRLVAAGLAQQTPTPPDDRD